MPPINHQHVVDNPSASQSPKPAPVVLSILLKPIIMLFILSLFLFIGIAAVFLLLLLLAGSSLHLCRRQHHRRRRSSNPTTTPSLEDLEKYIPQLNYDGKIESLKDCAVCLESFTEGEWCRRLPDCYHVFHLSCVDSWLAKVLNCPVCRAPVSLGSCGSCSFVSENDDFKLWWAVGD